MSVRPSGFGGGTAWTYTHDDATGGPHSGPLDPAALAYGIFEDQSPNQDVIVLQCPTCGDRSFHPASGGARAPVGDPALVQEMFVRLEVFKGSTSQAAIDDVRARALRLDGHLGAAAWLVDEDALLSALSP